MQEAVFKLVESSYIAAYISKNMDKGADYISKETGMNKSDVEWWMNTALLAGGHATGKLTTKGYELGKEGVGKAYELLSEVVKQEKYSMEQNLGTY